MSYDGAGWHDWLRGIDGAEEKVNNAFRVCRDMGFKTSAAMCLHRCDAYTLRESVNHLASLGVKSLKTGAVSFVGEWKKNNLLDQSLSTQELFKIYLDYIPLYYQDGMPLILTLSSFFAAYPEAPDYFEIINYKKEYDPQETLICAHARSSCYISPEGRVLVCMSVSEMDVQNKFPTVFEKSLAECVSSPEFMKLIDMRVSDFFAVNQECRECKYSKHCYGGCHAIFLELDRENCINESPVMCELYSGGWIDKIINTVKKINPSAKCNVYDM
ncbi:MAG: radical SAM protein [Synergistaceae bacterium]|nr:radical SAM protein [Synergistaceae bacterium]